MMHFKLIFPLFLFLLLNPNSNEETIAWRDSYKLSWENFRGEPKTNTDAVAVTASGITFSYSMRRSDSRIVDFSTIVEAHFYPNKSWYNKSEADAYILAHEQLHFDITELHVRKFRRQISQIKVNHALKSILDGLHQNINTELSTMQNLYDRESNNSIHKEQQAKWTRYIENELNALEAYKSKD
ncbi:DUF922 domain-containing protein [Flavobacteriales bacterium 34_180_T64]|nr:DUF922 domain-containing protein [Flavobacteriales bacterium 34_180_T64]